MENFELNKSQATNEEMLNDEQRERLNQEFQQEYARLEQEFADVPDIRELIHKKLAEQYGEGTDEFINKEQRETRRLNSAIEDVATCCRHAISINTDNIIFLENQARPDGVLTHMMFPTLRLEYCKLKNRPLNEVKQPKILFYNPTGRVATNLPQYIEKSRSQLENKITIVFDESSRAGGERDFPRFEKPELQYDFYNPDVMDLKLESKGNWNSKEAMHAQKEWLDRIQIERNKEAMRAQKRWLDRRQIERNAEIYPRQIGNKEITRPLVAELKDGQYDVPQAMAIAFSLRQNIPNAVFESHLGRSTSGQEYLNNSFIADRQFYYTDAEEGLFAKKNADSKEIIEIHDELKMIAKLAFNKLLVQSVNEKELGNR